MKSFENIPAIQEEREGGAGRELDNGGFEKLPQDAARFVSRVGTQEEEALSGLRGRHTGQSSRLRRAFMALGVGVALMAAIPERAEAGGRAGQQDQRTRMERLEELEEEASRVRSEMAREDLRARESELESYLVGQISLGGIRLKQSLFNKSHNEAVSVYVGDENLGMIYSTKDTFTREDIVQAVRDLLIKEKRLGGEPSLSEKPAGFYDLVIKDAWAMKLLDAWGCRIEADFIYINKQLSGEIEKNTARIEIEYAGRDDRGRETAIVRIVDHPIVDASSGEEREHETVVTLADGEVVRFVAPAAK